MLHKSLATALAVALLIPALLYAASGGATSPSPTYPLNPARRSGDAADVSLTLEVGGDLLVSGKDGAETALPLSVAAKLAYREQILVWSANPAKPARSLRQYSEAGATLKTQEKGVDRALPEGRRLIVAEATGGASALNSLDGPLTREQFDLLDVVGNSLVIDRLLPGRELKEGDGWDHDAATIGALLGMDHVAVCEVRSVVTGEENRQVQIRLAGGVQGTVDGAPTEMDLRAGYLYHLDERRITKFNLAIKEHRKTGEVSPGLDVVAKLTLTAAPVAKKDSAPFDSEMVKRAAAMTEPALRQLIVDAPDRGYRFHHDTSWYATAIERDLMSLRLIQEGDLLAHCNIATQPARPADKPLTLEQFEKDVCDTLGKKLDKVEAATEWKTTAGLRCLAIFANGTVKEVPMQWRHYRLSGDCQQDVLVTVTVEQSLLDRFASADKPLVESMELLDAPHAKPATTNTAARPSAAAAK